MQYHIILLPQWELLYIIFSSVFLKFCMHFIWYAKESLDLQPHFALFTFCLPSETSVAIDNYHYAIFQLFRAISNQLNYLDCICTLYAISLSLFLFAIRSLQILWGSFNRLIWISCQKSTLWKSLINCRILIIRWFVIQFGQFNDLPRKLANACVFAGIYKFLFRSNKLSKKKQPNLIGKLHHKHILFQYLHFSVYYIFFFFFQFFW